MHILQSGGLRPTGDNSLPRNLRELSELLNWVVYCGLRGPFGQSVAPDRVWKLMLSIHGSGLNCSRHRRSSLSRRHRPSGCRFSHTVISSPLQSAAEAAATSTSLLLLVLASPWIGSLALGISVLPWFGLASLSMLRWLSSGPITVGIMTGNTRCEQKAQTWSAERDRRVYDDFTGDINTSL